VFCDLGRGALVLHRAVLPRRCSNLPAGTVSSSWAAWAAAWAAAWVGKWARKRKNSSQEAEDQQDQPQLMLSELAIETAIRKCESLFHFRVLSVSCWELWRVWGSFWARRGALVLHRAVLPQRCSKLASGTVSSSWAAWAAAWVGKWTGNVFKDLGRGALVLHRAVLPQRCSKLRKGEEFLVVVSQWVPNGLETRRASLMQGVPLLLPFLGSSLQLSPLPV